MRFISADDFANLVGSLPTRFRAPVREAFVSLESLFASTPPSPFSYRSTQGAPQKERFAYVKHVAGIREELLAEAERLEIELSNMLAEMDPDIAIRSTCRRAPRLIQVAGLDRFIWSAAVGSGGTKTNQAHWDRYLMLCSEWLSLWLALEIFSTPSTAIEPWARNLFAGESIRRIYDQNTRLSTFSQLLSEGVVDWISSNSEKTSDLRAAARPALRTTFNVLREMGPPMPNHQVPVSSLAGSAMALLGLISLPAGALKGRHFEELVLTGQMERTPLIQHRDAIHAHAWRDAVLGFEVALLASISQRSNGQGEAFEHAVAYAVGAVSPNGLRILAGDLTVKPKVQGDELQTDFVLQGDGGTWVGECKGLLPSLRETGVAASFTNDLKRALAQTNKRVDHLTGPGWLASPTGNVHTGYEKVFGGLVVPLHSYGGALWDAVAMAEGHAQRSAQVIPIHSLLLVISTMLSAREFRQYCNYRRQLSRSGLKTLDELELLLMWLNEPARWTFTGYRSERKVSIAYSLPWEILAISAMPPDRNYWRQLVRYGAEPVNSR